MGGSKNSTRSVRSSTKSDCHGEEWDLCQVRTSRPSVHFRFVSSTNIESWLTVRRCAAAKVRDGEGIVWRRDVVGAFHPRGRCSKQRRACVRRPLSSRRRPLPVQQVATCTRDGGRGAGRHVAAAMSGSGMALPRRYLGCGTGRPRSRATQRGTPELCAQLWLYAHPCVSACRMSCVRLNSRSH